MASNIIELIQTGLGLPALQKVDPNIQEAKDKKTSTATEKLAQAAVPTVVAGIYRLSRTDEGCTKLGNVPETGATLDTIFDVQKAGVVEKVAQYANVPRDEAASQMETIAAKAVSTIHSEQKGQDSNPKALREYMSQQRHNILVYLPAAMQIGDLLNDNSMDDRTNKMEGPISNLVHKIENALARGES